MYELLPLNVNDSTSKKSKKRLPIYCVKFCPFNKYSIFAVAQLNKVEIYKNSNDEKLTKIRTFEAKKDEYFYALDWTIDRKTDEVVLIGGGMKGKIYNFLETSIFGVKIRDESNAINEIVFSPTIEHLFAVAYEDGSVALYSLKTESCIALLQTHSAKGTRQCIGLCFDPTGSYLAFGGMTMDIFIVNLKDCKEIQEKSEKGLIIDVENDPVKLNLVHNMCKINGLHENFVDAINWYAKNSLITKSANGDIKLWNIKGIDQKLVPFNNNSGLKLVLQQSTIIKNCNLWFIRFSLDPLLEYVTIGTCNGELVFLELNKDSFTKWKCHIFPEKNALSTIRHSSFSNNGKYLITCTDDGILNSYKIIKTNSKPLKKTTKP